MLLTDCRYVITQDDDRRVAEHVDIRIEDGHIAAIGDSLSADGEVIDCSRKVVMPGLINAHTHVPMALLRGISDDKLLQAWLEEDIFPAEEHLTADDVKTGAQLGIAEMLLSGTTTFNDMYAPETAVAEAVDETGIRAVLGQGMVDVDGDGDRRLRESKDFIRSVQAHDRITPAVAPHAIYTCSPEFLRQAQAQADRFDTPLHIHLSETMTENEDSQRTYDATPAQHLDRLGLLHDRTIAAHCTHLSNDDITLLADRGVGAAHNPCANLKLGSGVAAVHRMTGIDIGLGTDGPASNNSLNMFEEMKVAALLQKQQDPRQGSAQTVIDLATRGSAAVLGLNGIGRIAEGCHADIITLNLDDVALQPIYGVRGLRSNIVFSHRGTVQDTIVHGDRLVADGKLTGIDHESVIADSAERVARIQDATG